jgi:beta-lactamase class A
VGSRARSFRVVRRHRGRHSLHCVGPPAAVFVDIACPNEVTVARPRPSSGGLSRGRTGHGKERRSTVPTDAGYHPRVTRAIVAFATALLLAGTTGCSSDPGSGLGGGPGVDSDGGALEPDADGATAADGSTTTDGGGNPDSAVPPQKVPCPTGMPDRWTCDAASTHRLRCIDGFVQTFACSSGCVAGTTTTEATCACGASASFSHWNCGADGDLHSCAGGSAWLDQSCDGRGCDVAPVGVSDTCKVPAGSSLQTVIASLGAKCGTESPGTTCGISVRDLTTGEAAHHRGNAFYVSASSAKAIWVAAALYDTSIAAVMPHAVPIFRDSDNSESGLVIDLLASPARVNTFMWQDIGIPDSGFCSWNFDKQRNATNCPSTAGGDNFFTADDMAMFMTAMWDRSLLGDPKSSTELDWMTLSPRSGYGGWMGTLLPAAAQPKVHHKAGWLPPDVVPGYSNSNEIGVVEVPGGHAYAVALLMNGAGDITAYDTKQLPLLEKASCVVYHAIAKDVADPFVTCGL